MEQIRTDSLPGPNSLLVSEPSCILILVMHRSGTSTLAGCLQDRGLHLGEVSEKNPFNTKGNRENPWVMRLNNSVLLKSGGKWNNPPDKISWTEDLALERDDLVAFFKHSGARRWEFKDPRTLLTLPFWEEGISRISFVGTFRHPMAVANSLNTRKRIPIEHALALWRRYNQELLFLWEKKPFPIVSFDDPRADYMAATDRAAAALGLSAPRYSPLFFEERLRHHVGSACGLEIGEEELKIYSELCRIKEVWS
jgi:hypothetical protein